jgi:hypothetical protein
MAMGRGQREICGVLAIQLRVSPPSSGSDDIGKYASHVRDAHVRIPERCLMRNLE